MVPRYVNNNWSKITPKSFYSGRFVEAMNKESLAKVASDIVSSGRGILAADESTPTMGKRLALIGQENT